MFISSRKKLHVSAYSGHLQVSTTFLLKEFYIICLNRVVMLQSHHHFTCFVKLPNRKDLHPATYKFIGPIDIPPNFSLTKHVK